MIYVDASAIMKLIVEEPESASLAQWMKNESASLITSIVSTIEVTRVCRRMAPNAMTDSVRMLAEFDIVPVTAVVVDLAASVQPAELRTLDAIHLATALSVRDELTAFVTYDKRLGKAAHAEKLRVAAPN